MRKITLLSTIAALVACGAAGAQGYFDFGKIPGLTAEPTVQIDLNPAMLAFVAEAAKGADPKTAEVLAGIQGVRVNVYEDIGHDLEAVTKFVDDTSKVLERDGWHRTVFVQEGDEKVRLYMKLGGTANAAASDVTGLVMMVVDGSGEAVFINVAGRIQPAQLGQIANAIGMGNMFAGFGLGGPPPPNGPPQEPRD